jgi:hypothetical protein
MAQASYQGGGLDPKGQAANRRSQIWTDQHKRKWFSTVDLRDRSGAPACPLDPHTWTAPVIPTQNYLRMHEDKLRYGEIVIDYELWHAQLLRDQADYDAALDRFATGLAQGDDQLRAKLMMQPTASIIHALGPKPLSPRYVLACMAGDPWALGFTTDMPKWAQKIWPDPATLKPKQSPAHDFSFLEDEGDGVKPDELVEAVTVRRAKRSPVTAPSAEE